MPKKVGIVGTNPEFLAALYWKIIQKTIIHSLHDHLDVALYVRHLTNKSPYFNILEGTETMKKLGMDFAVFPEIDVKGNLPNQLPILSVQKDLELSSDKIVSAAKGDEELVPVNNKKPDSNIMEQAGNHSRHKKGFIGIHGGLGVEAGLRSFEYTTKKYNGSVLLYSAPSTKFEVGRILELEKKLPLVFQYMNALPDLQSTRISMKRAGVNISFMACNTAHYYQTDLIKTTPRIETIEIIEEGIKKIPENGAVFVLATTESVKSKLFEKAAERLRRKDIKLIMPSDEYQKIVNSAIFDNFVLGQIDQGTQKLKQIIDRYNQEIHKGIKYLAGCTEIIFGLESLVDKNHIIDNAEASADRAIELAEKRGKFTEIEKRGSLKAI